MAIKLPIFSSGYRLFGGEKLTTLVQSVFGVNGTAQFQRKFVTAGLVAHAGGAQAGATPIPSDITEFDTVTTTADSSAMPVAVPGMRIVVINNGANSMNIFPGNTTDQINFLGANTAYPLAGFTTVEFVCAVVGHFHTH